MNADTDFQKTYGELLHLAYDVIKPQLDKYNYVEGNILSSTDFIPKIYNIYCCAKLCGVHMRALEIGFNAGFSTILMLLSNPNLYVDAVDIGDHGYVDWCASLVEELFPNRFRLIKGDSKMIVPQMTQELYDLVHIDGDHSEQGAATDIINVLRLAIPHHTKVILDDTDIPHIERLWKIAMVEGYIENTPLHSETEFHKIGIAIRKPS